MLALQETAMRHYILLQAAAFAAFFGLGIQWAGSTYDRWSGGCGTSSPRGFHTLHLIPVQQANFGLAGSTCNWHSKPPSTKTSISQSQGTDARDGVTTWREGGRFLKVQQDIVKLVK